MCDDKGLLVFTKRATGNVATVFEKKKFSFSVFSCRKITISKSTVPKLRVMTTMMTNNMRCIISLAQSSVMCIEIVMITYEIEIKRTCSTIRFIHFHSLYNPRLCLRCQ